MLNGFINKIPYLDLILIFFYNSFRFKKIRALPDFESDEDNSKTASQQTSTPNKKLSDEPDVVSFRLGVYFSPIYCPVFDSHLITSSSYSNIQN